MSRKKDPSEKIGSIAPFGLRMLPDLRAKLEKACEESGRSLNAEIVARLEASLAEFDLPEGWPSEHKLMEVLVRTAETLMNSYLARIDQIAGLSPEKAEQARREFNDAVKYATKRRHLRSDAAASGRKP